MTTITTSPADPFTYGGPGGKQRMIPDEHTGKPLPYARVSTVASTLDDKASLGYWQAWMALRGTQAEGGGDMMARALHAQRTPRGTISDLIDMGGGSEARERGTRRHSLLAMALTGADLALMPPEAHKELDAVLQLVHSLGEVVAVEAATVNDAMLRAPDGQIIVADFKTGNHAPILSTGIQTYLHASGRYWVDGARGDWVSPRKPRLVMLHAPQDGSPPQAVDIDPDKAKDWAQLAVAVRLARKEAR
jgi:hypothetical protein